MPYFEIDNEDSVVKAVEIESKQVASVGFNDAAQKTEITLKPLQSVTCVAGSMSFQDRDLIVVPVVGTVDSVKAELGLK